jgi:hypothetical protein
MVLALFLLSASRPAPALGQAMNANFWVTDGDVSTIAPFGNTLYIGGNFAYVGPNTGGWAELELGGHATSRLPRLDGDVTMTIPDGATGWFIAGTFTHVAGIARPGLAHVLGDGSLAAWSPNPAPAGAVTSIEHQGARLFVASDAGQLIAYDDATGSVVAGWTPQVTGTVSSLAINGTTLFAGGDISFTITSTAASGTGIAAISTTTGAIANFDPAPDAPVTRIQAEGRWLYATGTFTSIGGQPHASLARALIATRVFDAGWNPSVDSPVTALAASDNGLWIGGSFFFVNGGFQERAAVLDTTSGATLGLTPNLAGIDGPVTSLVSHGAFVYLGLSPQLVFNLGGSARPFVVRMFSADGTVDPSYRVLGLSVPTGEPGFVSDLRFTPSGLLVSGKFVSAGGRHQVAVAAIDKLTGSLTPWDPTLAVDEAFPTVASVTAIVPTDHAIYLGGYFTHAGGQLRKSLAAIDPATGRAESWQADLGPTISLAAGSAAALTLYLDKLVVGGAFSSIKGVTKSSLAQVDTVTGAPVAGWTANVSGSVNCLLKVGTTVFVGGGFNNVGGQARVHVAAVNGANGAVLAWNPIVEGVQVQSFANRGDSLYIGGDYSTVAGQNRICLAAVSASAGTLLGWAPSAFGPVRALSVDGPNLITGGEFQFIAGQPTAYLAALDRFTAGLAAGTTTADGNVLALAPDVGALYLGGSFGHLGSSPTAFLGRMGSVDGAGPSIAVVKANGAEYLPVGTRYRFEYAASDPSGVASVDLELSRTGAAGPWTLLAAGTRNTGDFEWLVSAPAVAGNAYLRVTARDFAGNLANDRSDLAFSIGALIASVGPPQADDAAAFTLGPNPARLATALRFTLGAPAQARFRLLDVQGREVWSTPARVFAAGEHQVACELNGVAPGLYFMRFERGSESRTARLVVCR